MKSTKTAFRSPSETIRREAEQRNSSLADGAAFFYTDACEQLDPPIGCYLLLVGRRLAYGVYDRGPAGFWLVVRAADALTKEVVIMRNVPEDSWPDIVDVIMSIEQSGRTIDDLTLGC